MAVLRSVFWPPSLWAATAPAGPSLPALEGDQATDVVVIGAGFTGLSTAIHLGEMGVGATIVEAVEPGWGASGRNNGQVIPTLSGHDPSAMVKRHGEAGERFNVVLRDSVSCQRGYRPESIRCVFKARSAAAPHHLKHVGTITLELALADAADLR